MSGLDDDAVEIDILVGATGVQQTIQALNSLDDALAEIRAGGGGVSQAMEAIAKAGGQMDAVLSKSAGSVENASKNLSLLRNTLNGLRESYAALAASNLGASPAQLIEMFGPENAARARQIQETLSRDVISDYDLVANAAREASQKAIRAEQERSNAARRSSDEYVKFWTDSLNEIEARQAKASKARGDGFAAVQAQENENLLASMTPLEQAQRRLADAMAREASARTAAASAGGAYAAAVKNYGRGSQEATDAAVRHGKALQELAKTMGVARGANDQLIGALNQQGTGLRNITEETDRAHTRFQSLQYALFYTSFMLSNVGNIGKDFLVDVFKATIDLEAQFAQVDRTVEDFDVTTRTAMQNISREIPVALDKIAEIGTLGGALNIGADNIVGFTKTVAILAATTNLTEDAAGTLLGRMDALLDLDPDGSDFERIGAAVLDVGARSAATESQVARMAAQVAGLGKNLGLTAPQIIGWSGALSSVGVSAELGRSSLQRIFNVLNRNARNGGAGLEVLGQLTRQTGADFKRSLGEDASGALLSVVEGLRDLTASGRDSVETLNALGIRNVRDVYALQQLAAAYENTTRVLNVANEAYANSGQVLQDYYGPIAVTTAARLQKLDNAWTTFMDSLGSSTQGPLNQIVDDLTRMVNGLEDFNRAAPGLATMVVKFIAAGAVAFLAAGAVAQMGSAAANMAFVLQQLNTVDLPIFIKKIMLKTGLVKGDTAAAMENAIANQAAGNAALTAGQKMTAGLAWVGKIAKVLAFAAILLTLADALYTVGGRFGDIQDDVQGTFAEIARGNGIVGGLVLVLSTLLLGLTGVAEAAYVATNFWKVFTGELEKDQAFQAIKTMQAGLYNAINGTNDGLWGQVDAIEEAAEVTQPWIETLDDASVAAAIAAGEGDNLGESIEGISSSSLDATRNMADLVKQVAEAAGSYASLGSSIDRAAEKAEAAFGDNVPDGWEFDPSSSGSIAAILAEWSGSNAAVQAFQANLSQIAEAGGVALASALATSGIEQAGGIAEALVGNPELQRQFQVQARISGLLANDAFIQAFITGSDAGLSDAVAIEMAGLGASMETIFSAVEASSYGAGSDEWIEFVRGWNAENAATPLTIDGFELSEEALDGTVATTLERIRNQEPVYVPWELTPPDQTVFATTAESLANTLQTQLDANVLTPPMAFDQIAMTEGYATWQDFVAANPTFADVDPNVSPESMLGLIYDIRRALNSYEFNIPVKGRYTGTTGVPKVVAENRYGGHVGPDGIARFAGGGGWGLVGGRGTGTSDSNLSWLSKGEYVQPSSATNYYGVPMMDAIRAKQFPTMDQFAMMMRSAAMAVSGNSGPQSVTNVALTQNNPVTRDPLKQLREDSESLVAGLWGRG